MSKAHGEPDFYYRPQHTDLAAFERGYQQAFATRHCPVCGTPMTRRYVDHQRQEHCPRHGHILSNGDEIQTGDEVYYDGHWITIALVDDTTRRVGEAPYQYRTVRRPA